jgi:AcrR family transcriptional regulator
MAPIGDTGAATRDHILAAALDLAGREGLEALTTRRVAAKAGVNLGLIHYYFESKEALVDQTIGLYFGEINVAVDAAEIGEAEVEERLVRIFSNTMAVVARRPGLLFGLASRLMNTIKEDMRKGSDTTSLASVNPIMPFGPLAPVQGFLVGRIKPLIAERLGDDEELVSRRAIQLFVSVFHPILFTFAPDKVFGHKLSTEERRLAYVRGVVADALRP